MQFFQHTGQFFNACRDLLSRGGLFFASLFLGAMLGQIFYGLLALADPALARLLIALIAFGSFLLVLLPKKPAHYSPSLPETGGTGLLSGILTGFAGMPGPPVVPYYLRREIAPELARASMMTIFLVTSLAGVIAASALGVATVREPIFAAVLFPAVLLGNWLGTRAFGTISDTAWRSFTGAVLGLSALAALLKLLQA